MSSEKKPDSSNGPLSWLKNNWNQPAQGIAALATGILSFFQPPDEGIILGSHPGMLALVRGFIVPVVWLVMSVPARAYAARRHTLGWLIAGVLTFFLALSIWIVQAQLSDTWTCHSRLLNKRFVIGQTFTKEAIEGRKLKEKMLHQREIIDQEAVELLEETPPEELIEGAEQNPNLVWKPAEIRFRRLIVTTLYMAGVPVFAISLIAALQAWYCAGRRRNAAGE
jgi:hypothetical protein